MNTHAKSKPLLVPLLVMVSGLAAAIGPGHSYQGPETWTSSGMTGAAMAFLGQVGRFRRIRSDLDTVSESFVVLSPRQVDIRNSVDSLTFSETFNPPHRGMNARNKAMRTPYP